jgi:16S rRNA (adenine1518-N6/adenine1519-N6)-dimethyltransferase
MLFSFFFSIKTLVYKSQITLHWMQMKRKPKFGQNFLVDDAARHAIVDALGDLTERTVIEIGPGHGAITEILALRCHKLVALEFDRALAAELTFRFRDQTQVQIIEGDFLKTDLRALAPKGETVDVIGNLPYYITSDILLKLFATENAGLVARGVLMMQREVADRVSAEPGVRDYGLLSATAQMSAQVENLFTLPPSAFSPPPDVYSTVLRLHFAPRFAELGVDAEGFDKFLKQCFAQKRKTLQNNLRAAGYAPEKLAIVWPTSIPPQARAESLGLEPMAELYLSLSKTGATAAADTSE